ncbi:MAG: hypothetical protein K2O59_01625 [Lachnospiraceae bacterium]|nr:hypothetical protein [Lachnospiraceae bacterium]MDE7176490.1 hypothetical protein [Lachnospiraceae bacterium]
MEELSRLIFSSWIKVNALCFLVFIARGNKNGKLYGSCLGLTIAVWPIMMWALAEFEKNPYEACRCTNITMVILYAVFFFLLYRSVKGFLHLIKTEVNIENMMGILLEEVIVETGIVYIACLLLEAGYKYITIR